MINALMNIILILINSVITCLVVITTVVGAGVQDVNYWIGCMLAFVSGFGLRMMGDIRNKKIGWLNSFVQFVSSVCLCMAALVFKPAFAQWLKIEYFIFFAALCSVYMIDVIEKTFKASFQIGFLNYVQLVYKGIINVIVENAKRKGGDQ